MRQDSYNKGGIIARLRRTFPITATLIVMAAIVAALIVLSLFFMDIWTHHGATSRVPDIKGMNVSEAESICRSADLTLCVSDSIYDDKRAPGSVVEVWPRAGAVVKAGREVYVTIVSFTPHMIVIDIPLTDMSVGQAQNYLNSRGINKVSLEYVESEYPDVVVAAKYNGQYVTMGTRIPANATVILQVGKVSRPDFDEDLLDSQIDSLLQSSSVADEVANAFNE